ncbi:MAG: glycosyltransferase family 1 protein [Lachnospiraceae bacterium]|nr:glycosyltransferase family 1 protein [Lachnospiraceae bacterium]
MSEAIRVLHVLGGVGLGGAESRIMDLYRQMDRNEIQFDFLVHSEAMNWSISSAMNRSISEAVNQRKPEFYDEEILSLGGHIYVLPKFKVYNYLSYRKAVRDFFRQHHEFRVVQGHMTSTAGIYLPIAKKYGIPVTVAHARNAGVVKGLKGIATRFFRRGLAQKADCCFACSKLAGEDVFGKAAMDEGRVKIIYNAIDAVEFTYDPKVRAQVRERLGLKEELVIGHVGRFNYQKNHPYLIDIFAKLCEIRQNAVLLMLGEGPDQENIREKCRMLGIEDKVRFLGNQRRPQDYYQAMDIFLLPSFFEGLPGVLVEAQAAGLKCFVSDTITSEAAATDLVTYLSTEQPAEAWAEQIAKAAEYERQNTFQRMKEAGFDVKTQAADYRLFYKRGDSSGL